MATARIRLGTSARRQQKVDPWLPRWAVRIGRSVYADGMPDGVAHGVPEGEAVALCGVVPAHVWPAPFSGEQSRILEVCGSCRALAPPVRPEVTARTPHATVPSATTAPTVADPWAVWASTPATPDVVDGGLDAGTDPYRHVPLPLPPIDTPEERRRERERRRRITVLKGVLPAVAIVLVLAVASGYEGGGSPRVGAPGGPVAEPAVWKVDPVRPPQTDARSFTALVSRVGCGEVGDVLAPQVLENPSSVTVIFTVPPVTSGGSACAMDAAVPYSVRLAAPLGERALFDGTCDLPPASTTAACVTAQRWPSQS